jgi:hypothetical protein
MASRPRSPRCRANLTDHDREARFADKSVRPELIVNLLLGKRARALLNEQAEQVERFRGEMDSLSMKAELSRIAVYDYFAAVVSHPPLT